VEIVDLPIVGGFRERSASANMADAKRLLKRARRGNPPVPGDELR
jgi:hypothetical protein